MNSIALDATGRDAQAEPEHPAYQKETSFHSKS